MMTLFGGVPLRAARLSPLANRSSDYFTEDLYAEVERVARHNGLSVFATISWAVCLLALSAVCACCLLNRLDKVRRRDTPLDAASEHHRWDCEHDDACVEATRLVGAGRSARTCGISGSSYRGTERGAAMH